MSAPNLDLTWQQGEDLTMTLLYQEGINESSVAPVNLTGFSLRMDIVSDTGIRLNTFNSAAISDVDPLVVGNQPDSEIEASLASSGIISITVSRSLTLPPSGVIYQQMTAATPKNKFNYDVFLRNTQGLQTKILKGTVTVEKSYTLWV